MRAIIIFILCLFLYWLGAVQHEKDMVRNFNEYGNARAWFGEIECFHK